MPKELNEEEEEKTTFSLVSDEMGSVGTRNFQARVDEQVGFLGNVGLGVGYAYKYLERKVRDESPKAFEKRKIDYDPNENGTGLSKEGVDFINAVGKGLVNIETIFDLNSPEFIDPDLDLEEIYDEATEGIPTKYHVDILAYGNRAGIMRARQRVLDDMQRHDIMSKQFGFTVTQMAGSLIDVDLPLMPFFGGGKLLTTTGNAVLKQSIKTGLASGTASGALIGGVIATSKEGAGASDAMLFTALGAITGGVMGAGTGAIGQMYANKLTKLGDDLVERVSKEGEGPDGVVTPETAVVPPKVNETFKPLPTGKDTIKGEIFETPKRKKGEPKPTKRTSSGGDSLSKTSNDVIDNVTKDLDSIDFLKRREEAKKSAAFYIASIPGVMRAFGVGLGFKMFKSDASVLQWISARVVEGNFWVRYGSSTSSAFDNLITMKILEPIRDIDKLYLAYKKVKGQEPETKRGLPIVDKNTKREVNRLVFLEMDARSRGGTFTDDVNVLKIADALSKSMQEAADSAQAKGMNPNKSVRGSGSMTKKGYIPKVFTGRIGDIIRRAPENLKAATRSAFVKGLSDNYININPAFTKEVADSLAESIVKRSLDKSSNLDIDMGAGSLLVGDGRKMLQQTLTESGLSEKQIKSFMKKLETSIREKGTKDFTKQRNELDLSAEIMLPTGEKIQIVDLINTNLQEVTQRYARKVSGSSALAMVGIRSSDDIEKIIKAALDEQDSLGIPLNKQVSREELTSIFSHFTGGPVQGYGKVLSAGKLEAQGALVSTMKRGANFAYLDQMGPTQVIEFGNQISTYGVASFIERGIKPMFSGKSRKEMNAFLEDVAFLSGDMSLEHRTLAMHRNLDDFSTKERGHFMDKLVEYGGNMQYLQAYVSAYNFVRKTQQRISMMGAADKLFRTVYKSMDKNGKVVMSKQNQRRMLDGYNADFNRLQQYADLISDGTVQMRKTALGFSFTNKLNSQTWSDELAKEFGASIHLNVNQAIQKAMAGEQDPWMFTRIGSLATQLVTFPMLAFNKQFLRQIYMKDVESITATLYSLGAAGAVSVLKDKLNQREPRSTAEHAIRAVSYSNVLGWLPMNTNVIGTISGIDELRFANKYTDQAGLTPVAVKWGEDLMRVLPATAAYIKGTADNKDKSAFNALPYTGVVGWTRAINNAGTRNVDKKTETSILNAMKDIDKFYENPQSFNFKELWDDTDGTSLSYLKDMFD
jgi:hypothetical protein